MNVIAGRPDQGSDKELERAEKALEQRVRAEVTKEYEPTLASAGRWRRFILRWKMESEINRRLGERLFARRAQPADPESPSQDRDGP